MKVAKPQKFLIKTTKIKSLKWRDMYQKPWNSQNMKSFLKLVEVNRKPNTPTRK